MARLATERFEQKPPPHGWVKGEEMIEEASKIGRVWENFG